MKTKPDPLKIALVVKGIYIDTSRQNRDTTNTPFVTHVVIFETEEPGARRTGLFFVFVSVPSL